MSVEVDQECCGNCLYFNGEMGGRDMFTKTGTVHGGKRKRRNEHD